VTLNLYYAYNTIDVILAPGGIMAWDCRMLTWCLVRQNHGMRLPDEEYWHGTRSWRETALWRLLTWSLLRQNHGMGLPY